MLNRESRLTIRLTKQENKNLLRYCKSTKQKKAPFVRNLILNEINKDLQAP